MPRGGRANKVAGVQFERDIRTLYGLKGWLTVRSRGSLGPVDVIALKPDNHMLMQCKKYAKERKSDGIPYIVPDERAFLQKLANLGFKVYLVYRAKKFTTWITLFNISPQNLNTKDSKEIHGTKEMVRSTVPKQQAAKHSMCLESFSSDKNVEEEG